MKFEKYSPLLITLIIIGVILLVNNDFINQIDFKNFLNSTQIVFTVLLGFLLTITTLLHTINTTVMQHIKTGGEYQSLTSYLKVAIYLSLIISFFTLVIPIIDQMIHKIELLMLIGKYTFIALVIGGSISSIRFIRLFLKIITK